MAVCDWDIRSLANQRALQLFLSRITPQERDFYQKYNCLWVKGDTYLYCLRANDSAYGVIAARQLNHTLDCYICVHPSAASFDNEVPVVDKMLIDYLFIKTYRDEFYRIGNKNPYRPPTGAAGPTDPLHWPAYDYYWNKSNYWIPPGIPDWVLKENHDETARAVSVPTEPADTGRDVPPGPEKHVRKESKPLFQEARHL